MKTITLYHYSNKDFIGHIKSCFFGYNSYTTDSQRISKVKRSYFYLDKNKKEYYFNGCQFLYITKIQDNKLYDIDKDCQGIVAKLKYNEDLYKVIKHKGYDGIISYKNIPQAVIFKDMKIIDKKVLTNKNNVLCYV